jgi:hypothetical protein
MSDPLPIPPHIWQHILAFLRDGKTGEVVLNVHGGAVHAASLKECLRAEDRNAKLT